MASHSINILHRIPKFRKTIKLAVIEVDICLIDAVHWAGMFLTWNSQVQQRQEIHLAFVVVSKPYKISFMVDTVGWFVVQTKREAGVRNWIQLVVSLGTREYSEREKEIYNKIYVCNLEENHYHSVIYLDNWAYFCNADIVTSFGLLFSMWTVGLVMNREWIIWNIVVTLSATQTMCSFIQTSFRMTNTFLFGC